MILNALIEKYGHKEGLTISGGTIQEWPYAIAKPTKAKLKTILDEYNAIERPIRKTLAERVKALEAEIITLKGQ